MMAVFKNQLSKFLSRATTGRLQHTAGTLGDFQVGLKGTSDLPDPVFTETFVSSAEGSRAPAPVSGDERSL